MLPERELLARLTEVRWLKPEIELGRNGKESLYASQNIKKPQIFPIKLIVKVTKSRIYWAEKFRIWRYLIVFLLLPVFFFMLLLLTPLLFLPVFSLLLLYMLLLPPSLEREKKSSTFFGSHFLYIYLFRSNFLVFCWIILLWKKLPPSIFSPLIIFPPHVLWEANYVFALCMYVLSGCLHSFYRSSLLTVCVIAMSQGSFGNSLSASSLR